MPSAREDPEPNIVLLMADDMGYGDLGCYNKHSKIPTPNMNKIAKEGVKFTDAHSASAVCTPSRYGLLTGRYPWRTRLKKGVIFDCDEPLIEADRPTIGSLLQEKGYVTGCIGKWHLGMGWHRDEKGKVDFSKPVKAGPTDRGFDYYFGMRASLDMPPYCFIENDHTVGIPSLEKDPYNPQQIKGKMCPGWKDEEVGPKLTEKAVQFIEESASKDGEKPFFLYFPTSAPHRPCVPPDFIKGRSNAGPRGDMVAEIDWTVGRLVDTLKQNNVYDETLFIVTSDNGARLKNYNGRDYGHKSNGFLRGQKEDIWDGGHREPFLARWPGYIEPHSICEETISLNDLIKTFSKLFDTSLPKNAGEDSYDITPTLLGEDYDNPIHEATIHHSFMGNLAIRKGPWKMILTRGSRGVTEPRIVQPSPDEPEGQLYNMDEDTQEQNNLWFDRQDIVHKLRELLNYYKQKGRSAPSC